MKPRQPRLRQSLVVGLIILFVSISPWRSFAQVEPPRATAANASDPIPLFAPGEVLVGFYTGAVRAAGLLANLEAQVIDSLDLRGLDGGTGDAGVTGYRLQVPVGAELATIEQLQQDPSVAFAEPNWIVRAAHTDAAAAVAKPETAFVVNDPSYVDKQWYLPRINAGRAWGLAYSDAGFDAAFTPIKVAIVDSGVDVNHPEFNGILTAGFNYISPDELPIDDCGHGTHIAGLVGALTNNGIGIAGVAPRVEIDPRKVLEIIQSGNFCGGTVENLAKGIRGAADAGAQIINMSVEIYSSGTIPTLQAAIQYATSKGSLLIAAGGNQSRAEVAYPARYSEVMAVAATTYEDRRASYSNTGTQIDLAAPGGVSTRSIYSTWAQSAYCRDILAPLPQSGYCNAEGTSMAAGIVSGAAALVWSLDSSLTMTDVRSLLIESAAPVNGTAIEVGSGRLDLHAALRHLLPQDLQVADTQIVDAVELGAAPYTQTIRIENPSLNPLTWEASLIDAPDWAQLVGATAGKVTGAARYGEPSHLQMVISPTLLSAGNYSVHVQIVGNLDNGNQVIQNVPVNLTVGAQPQRWYFPLIVEGLTRPQTGGFQWETPANSADRAILQLSNATPNLAITLPFTFTLQESAYTTARVAANGFVTLPDVTVAGDLTNTCLPDGATPPQAIYGWWADLDPSAAGAQVSTFQPSSDRFVIEFDQVPTTATITPAYTVSFQIVLYANGDIGLNYAQTPDLQTLPPPVTVGVEATDGLFYNQIACKDNTTELGYLPSSRQSFLLRAAEGVY